MDNNLVSPLSSENVETILRDIKKARKEGTIHHLYTYYQTKYGTSLSDNLVVPYKFQNKIVDLIIINHPKDAERLASDHIKKMPNLKQLLQDSIISTTDNNQWECQRRNLTGAFNVYENLEPIIPVSAKRAFYCSDLLWDISERGKTAVNINNFFMNETMAQLQLSLFGFDSEFEEETNVRIRKALGDFEIKYSSEYIQNFLDNIQDAKGPLGKELSEYIKNHGTKEQNIGNSIIFTFAGHDTTGHTLTWLIYELCKNKKYQKILQDEVDQFWIIQKGVDIKYNDLKRLPFMTKCILETLRLWPALANGTYRELEEDDYVHGKNAETIKVKKGTFIQIPNWSRHRNPELWGEDVNIFNPYRLFEEDENWNNNVIGTYNPNSERFSPFTYGPRDCIGKNFAQIEMRIILLYLLKSYSFTLTYKQDIMDRDKIMYNSFTMGPRNPDNETLEDNTNGLYVYVNKRNCISKI